MPDPVTGSPMGPPLSHRLAAHRFTKAQLLAIDVVTVVLVFVVSEFIVAPQMPGGERDTGGWVALFAAAAAVTLLRRRLPRATLAVVLTIAVVALSLRSGVGVAVFVMMALYSVVTVSSRRAALVIVGFATGVVLAGYLVGGGGKVIPAAIGGVAVVLLGWLAGEIRGPAGRMPASRPNGPRNGQRRPPRSGPIRSATQSPTSEPRSPGSFMTSWPMP